VIDASQYDPSYVGFSATAPPNSWKCETCTTKFSKSTDKEDLAVWNKPNVKVCRFCFSPAPNGEYEVQYSERNLYHENPNARTFNGEQ